MVMIEAKDSPLEDRDGVGFVQPLPIGPNELRALDEEIRSVFTADRVITPDRVRGRHATLAAAVETDGWPLLRAARGKVLFALDNTDQHRTDYLRGHPSLEGRMLFVSSMPGEPSAGFIKMNEALGEDEERIRRAGASRLSDRTRADVPTEEARTGARPAGRRVPIGRAVRQHRLSGAQSVRVRLRRPVARRRTPDRTLQSRECPARLPR